MRRSTQPLTFAATANCVLYQGEPQCCRRFSRFSNLDPDRLAESITPKHACCFGPSDYAGHPADLDPILAWRSVHGLTVIEDACHALGAEYQGRRTGSIAHMSIFSFHPVKHLATGEGGMVTTRTRADLAEKRCAGSESWNLKPTAPPAPCLPASGTTKWCLLGFQLRLTDIAVRSRLSQLEKTGGESGPPPPRLAGR